MSSYFIYKTTCKKHAKPYIRRKKYAPKDNFLKKNQ